MRCNFRAYISRLLTRAVRSDISIGNGVPPYSYERGNRHMGDKSPKNAEKKKKQTTKPDKK